MYLGALHPQSEFCSQKVGRAGSDLCVYFRALLLSEMKALHPGVEIVVEEVFDNYAL